MIEFVRASVQASAWTLLGRYYASEDVFRLEAERIFYDGWVCVGRAEQIPKATHGKGPYRFAIESGEQIAVIVFVREDAEMVLPKINHQLEKLLFAVNGPQDFRTL